MLMLSYDVCYEWLMVQRDIDVVAVRLAMSPPPSFNIRKLGNL